MVILGKGGKRRVANVKKVDNKGNAPLTIPLGLKVYKIIRFPINLITIN